MRPSLAAVDEGDDNALCESFFATLECTLLERHRLRSQAGARMAVFEFIEEWYNPRRRQLAIGYPASADHERSTLPPLALAQNRPRNRGNANQAIRLELVDR